MQLPDTFAYCIGMILELITDIYNAMVKRYPFLTGIIVGALLVVSLCKFDLINLNSKKYGYVNVETVISSLQEELLKQNIETKEAEQKLKDYKAKFESIIEKMAESENMVIFTAIKPIGGAEDLTNKIIKLMVAK